VNRKQLNERLEKVIAHMRDEQKLKVEVRSLNLDAARFDVLAKNLERQNQILGEIEKIRHNKILPILRDVARFVRGCQHQKKPSAAAARRR